MHTLKTWLAVGFAGSLLTYPLADPVRVNVDTAPPRPVIEDAPVCEAYIYPSGYWDWNDAVHRHCGPRLA